MTEPRKNELKSIMSLGWRIHEVTGETFAACLTRAWLNHKLRNAMRTRIVRFIYIKKSTGELRTAYGTTDPHRYTYTPTGTGRNGNFSDCVQYWDTEAHGFRMFKSFNLVAAFI